MSWVWVLWIGLALMAVLNTLGLAGWTPLTLIVFVLVCCWNISGEARKEEKEE